MLSKIQNEHSDNKIYLLKKHGSDTNDIRIEFLPQCKFQDCYGPFSASLRAASILRSVPGILRLTLL